MNLEKIQSAMTPYENLIIGGVYKTIYDTRPIRIIGFDNVELFYDVWWEHSNNWALKSHNAKTFFYRASVIDFTRTAELIKIHPLNNNEIAKYRLDLPFRMCRDNNIGWTDKVYSNALEFENMITQKRISTVNSNIMNIETIMLYPYGPKGGLKKSSKLRADNGRFFTEKELLWKAHNLQSIFVNQIKDGVGIYRLGLEKGMASYYIGGFYDNAGFLKEPT